LNWTHPDIPDRFAIVHAEWSGLPHSERERFKRRLATARDYATLRYFHDWEHWYRAASSPWRWQREGEQ